MSSPAEPGVPAASTQRSPDWPVQVAETIESVVGSIRAKTAVPLETIARVLVYGILIAVMGTAALVLVVIASVRAGTYVLPVWAVYAILGLIFTSVGLLLWRKRRPPEPNNTTR